nr:ATP-binding protein [uncultured Dongia sp.]
MKESWSLARRLVLALTLGLGVLWLGAVAVSALVTMHELNEVFDSALQETAQRLLPLATDDLEELAEDDDRAIGGTVAGHREYLIYQVRDAAGRVILRSHDAPLAAFPIPLVHGFSDMDGRRFYTEVALENGFAIQVAEKAGHRAEALLDTLIWLASPLLLLLPLAGSIIYWTVGRTVRPIRAVREAIRARGGSNLAVISDAGLPSELAPIVKDVNRLLERLGRALEAERAFAANSAHELRTPVATALAQIQRLGAELEGTPHQARLQQITTAMRRLGHLVEKLLQLSRAESGIAMSEERSDLAPVMRLVLDEIGRQTPFAGRIDFDMPPAIPLMAAIDIDAFAIVFRNLVENALLHGAATVPVRIFVDADQHIHVVNRGPAVPAPAIPHLTDRFTRGTSGAPGSGLGLAIADTILRQAGGALELHSPAQGHDDGFEAVIILG